MSAITNYLDQAQARADAATDGPWEHTGWNGVHTRVGSCVALSYRHDDRQRCDDALGHDYWQRFDSEHTGSDPGTCPGCNR